MILVDTSIWIDFFGHPDSSYTEKLEKLIKDNNRTAICGIILQEILQGIKEKKSYELTKGRLVKFPFIQTEKEAYLHASSLYRKLSKKGITLPSVDVTIASIAILNNLPLFTKDKHFDLISKYSDLIIYR